MSAGARRGPSGWRFERPPDFPRPLPAAEAAPFFAALAAHRLVIQRCAGCGELAHPPRALCPLCGSSAFEWQEARGDGVVHSYAITCQAVHPAFAGYTPLATVEVRLREGVILTSNLLDVPPQDVAIGMAVDVVFEDIGDGIVLPLFRRAGQTR